MKKLYIVARNHMDPTWLRCFRDHFVLDDYGGVVRPYSDVEEMQILEYMDFAEQYGVKYHIEQSLVVKVFLERNPDQKERFKNLVKKGLFELAGGGETVIDCNMTQGESWVRNHLYSRKYYKEEFDHTPKYAITPDIFGLPSQLPQFFRSIGYDALIIFDRVMLKNKPFWQGLDGTKIVLDKCWLNVPEPGLRTADCTKIRACKACHGEGCDICEGTGIDFSYTMTRPDKEMEKFREAYYGNMSAEEMLSRLLEKNSDEYFLMIVTEEPRVGEFLYGPLREAAKKMDFDVKYLTFEENHDRWCKGQVEALRNGKYSEDEVDTRAEGNPVFTGCYSSRIEIKKANHELEDLLGEAERLAVLARMNGGWNTASIPRRDFPKKKIEDLWSKMAFIQFHDCVPGSMCDGSYYELLRYIREVRRGAEQIYNDAALECLRTIGCEAPAGYKAAVYFNMDTNTASNPRLMVHAPAGTKNIEVYDTDMKRLTSYNAEAIDELVGTSLRVSVRADVPALGWKIFLWKPVEEAEKINVSEIADTLRIENEYYTVTADRNGITEIYDKKNNRAAANGIGLAISIDIGSPWIHGQPESGLIDLTADSIVREEADGFSRFVLKGVLSDESRKIEKLAWTQTVTLNKGEALVRVSTDLDWDGTNTRVFGSVVPAFKHTGKLWGEVPFGTMERDDVQKSENPEFSDEWPTLGFAGVSDGKYNLAILKGGLPGSRVRDDKLQIILLRAFDCGDSRYSETSDRGKHTSEYAITTWTGTFTDGCCSAKSSAFNAHGLTRGISDCSTSVSEPEGCMIPALANIPAQIRLSAIKWSEDDMTPVVRFWESTGREAVLKMPENVKLIRCNTLEEECGDAPVSEYTFRPFEIATFRMITC